jgi:hypothetical protein
LCNKNILILQKDTAGQVPCAGNFEAENACDAAKQDFKLFAAAVKSARMINLMNWKEHKP